MKRLIVCCDGTWQSQNNKVATNVLKIAQAIETKGKDKKGNEISQILYYDQGIGAVPNYGSKQSFLKNTSERLQKLGGGAFGWGIDEKIEEAYIFLCLNYEPKDEIYLFGFSRGAYTVRSLAGLISYCGLLQRPDINHTADAYKIYRTKDETNRKQKADNFCSIHQIKDINIKFLGCWDTVGALGIPNIIPCFSIDKYLTKKYKFHNNKLSSIIENARHAIAIDEKRSALEVTLMKPGDGFEEKSLKQVWFPGDHGCVGGGSDEIIELSDGCQLNTLDLSKVALEWMAEEAKQLDLDLDLKLVKDCGDLASNQKYLIGNKNIREFVNKILRATLKPIQDKLSSFVIKERDLSKFKDLEKDFDESVIDLWCDRNYRPNNLSFINKELEKHCFSKKDVDI
ncbi:DUF2235 domain-containing protein [Myxosarcina sp. GI1]|uniref:DUF2235 domain-containing protein n=1 Tax=Myxosarcina sp. GI1 TaxID=1541065 RepID=UPI0005655EFE|nr:DUF2235 domain-containing protein [Myxosarcina sp. GI1]